MTDENRPNKPAAPDMIKTALFGLAPLALLGIVVYILLSGGPTAMFQTELPPVEEISIIRHVLSTDLITVDVVNSGPDPTTIAQVMVRGAFWNHDVTPHRTLQRLETARISIPYPWIEGEPYEITLLTSTGLTFPYGIEVATATPRPTLGAFGRFAMLGIYVGVIPVFLGICWFPFLRRLSKRALNFLIYVTAGLLAFLVVDAVVEGLEAAESLPGAYHGTALLALGIVGAYLVLSGAVSQAGARLAGKGGVGASSPNLTLAWTIALGIGLHNLGEGLGIGSAYVLGNLNLGALLVVGFTIHNITEGIAIVAPILEERQKLSRFIGLGALGGIPTIAGCWIGAFTYSPVWAVLFLGIGAGAIIQVIGAIVEKRGAAETFAPLNIAGVFVGYLLMYGTSYFVGG